MTTTEVLATHFSSQQNEHFSVSIIITLQRVIRKPSNNYFIDIEGVFSFDGENYHPVENSQYPHEYTIGLANYRGKALTTGCNNSNVECSLKTEIMDMATLKWSIGPDYPFSSRSVTRLLNIELTILFKFDKVLFDCFHPRCSIYHWWFEHKKRRSRIQG